MSGYIGTQPVPQATQKRQAFTATAGQTTFATSGYSVGFVDVYMNGVKLAAADYTATNGSDVVLATAALVNDIIETVSFTSFVASDGLAVANNLSDVASASTALTNLGVTSTAAELNTLDAVPRGSIIYGNSSAATARLSKGATGTVLTAGADDISWVEASGGGEQTFTASGTISNGNIVGLNANGTVSVLEASFFTPVDFGNSAFANYISANFDPDTNKIIVSYRPEVTNYPTVVIGTVSGNSISFGTPVVADSNARGEVTACYDTTNDKLALFYVSSGFCYGRVGTVSGTSISFGSQNTVITDAQNQSNGYCQQVNCCFDSNAGKVVLGWFAYNTDGGSNEFYGASKTCTISGNSMSTGTGVRVNTVTYGAPSPGQGGMVFDSNINKVMYICAYAGGLVSVGTVSGTNISYGTGVAIEASVTTDTARGVFCGGSINKTVISYYSGGNKTVVCSVSGTTPSFGAISTLPSSLNYTCNVPMFDPDTNRVFLLSDKTNNGPGAMVQIFVDGTGCGFGPVVTLSGGAVIGGSMNSGYQGYLAVAYDTNSDKMVLFASSQNTGSGSVSGQAAVINSGQPSFIGVAAAAISNGATGKITVVSGINEGQSGLQISAPYGYNPATGTLVIGGNNVFATAIAADKLFVTKGTA